MAQYGSQQAFVGGPLGMTPSPSPTQQVAGGQRPSGMSPTAKRPLDRSAHMAMEADAPQKIMSAEELTQGFYNLVGKQTASEKWTMDIAGVVHENATLLNAVIGRINVVDGRGEITQKQLDELAVATRGMLEKVDEKNIGR